MKENTKEPRDKNGISKKPTKTTQKYHSKTHHYSVKPQKNNT
jgi:hypothetical protein